MTDVLARLTELIKAAQTKLGVAPDGVIGPVTLKAAAAWLTAASEPPAPPPPPPSPWVLHTEYTFDDGQLPADIRVVNGPFGNSGPTAGQCLHDLLPSQVTVTGGALRITAEPGTFPQRGDGIKRTWKSGGLQTRIERGTGTYFPRYGRYEFRARFPQRPGIWPGLWLRHRGGASVAEPDLAEYLHVSTPGRIQQTLHLAGRQNVALTASKADPAAWHTYAVEILPVVPGKDDQVRFRYLLDDIETLVYVDTQAAQWTGIPDPSRCWDIAAQIYVGGKWAGSPDSTAPAVLEIDSIRVFTPRVMS